MILTRTENGAPKPIECPVGAFTGLAGTGISYESPFEERRKDAVQCAVDKAIPDGRDMNLPRLRIDNAERPVAAMPVGATDEIATERGDIVGESQ